MGTNYQIKYIMQVKRVFLLEFHSDRLSFFFFGNYFGGGKIAGEVCQERNVLRKIIHGQILTVKCPKSNFPVKHSFTTFNVKHRHHHSKNTY